MGRIPEEEDHVGGRLRQYLDCLEDGEFESLVFLPELGKKDGRYGVQRKDSAYIYCAVPESVIAEG